jgi:hypothetical protein
MAPPPNTQESKWRTKFHRLRKKSPRHQTIKVNNLVNTIIQQYAWICRCAVFCVNIVCTSLPDIRSILTLWHYAKSMNIEVIFIPWVVRLLDYYHAYLFLCMKNICVVYKKNTIIILYIFSGMVLHYGLRKILIHQVWSDIMRNSYWKLDFQKIVFDYSPEPKTLVPE